MAAEDCLALPEPLQCLLLSRTAFDKLPAAYRTLLIDALKRQLKQRGITYATLARQPAPEVRKSSKIFPAIVFDNRQSIGGEVSEAHAGGGKFVSTPHASSHFPTSRAACARDASGCRLGPVGDCMAPVIRLQCVMTTSTLQGACSMSAPEMEPRHQRAAQLSRCLWPTNIKAMVSL